MYYRVESQKFLKGFWKLDGDAQDSAGNNNGEWVGNEDYEKNQFGKLVGKFDGSSYLKLFSSPELDFSGKNEFSIILRLKTDFAESTPRMMLMQLGNNEIRFFKYYGRSEWHVIIEDEDGGSQSDFVSSVGDSGEWIQLACTYDRTHLTMYKNCISSGSPDVTAKKIADSPGDNFLGANNNGSDIFQGLMGPIRVYNIGLTLDEIKYINALSIT